MSIKKKVTKRSLILSLLMSVATGAVLAMEADEELEDWQRRVAQQFPADLRPSIKWQSRKNERQLHLFWSKDNWNLWRKDNNSSQAVSAIQGGDQQNPQRFILVIPSIDQDVVKNLNEWVTPLRDAVKGIILKDSYPTSSCISNNTGNHDLVTLLKNCPNIEEFNAKRCALKNAEMFQFISALEGKANLKILKLSHNNIDSQILDNLQSTLSELSKLEILNLSNNPQLFNDMDNSSKIGTNFTNSLSSSLKSLKLASTGMSGKKLREQTFNHLTSLTHLNLSGNDLHNEDKEESAFLHLITAILPLQSLNSITISNTHFKDDDLIQSSVLLSIFPALKSLDISNNRISTPKFEKFLIDTAKNFRCLNFLNVANNKEGENPLDVSSLFNKNDSFVKNLQSLNISGNKVDFSLLSAFLPNFSQLHSLQVGNIRNHQNKRKLNEEQDKNKKIKIEKNKSTSISTNNAYYSNTIDFTFAKEPSEKFLTTLSSEVWTRLRVLNLEGLKDVFQIAGPAIVTEFTRALGKMFHLKSLNLSETRIGDFEKCNNDLFKSLASLASLKELRLGNFSATGFSNVLSYIVPLNNLRILDLSNNQGDKPYINLKDINHLWNHLDLRRWPHLRELYLGGNNLNIIKILNLKAQFDPSPIKLDKDTDHLFQLLRENNIAKAGLEQKLKIAQAGHLTPNDFSILLSPYLRALPTLTALDLSHSRLGNEGAIAVAGALENNSQIMNLDLSSNNIGQAGVQALAQKLLNSKAVLKILSLKGNEINSEGMRPLVGSLITNTHFENLEISESHYDNTEKEAHAIIQEIGRLLGGNKNIKVNGLTQDGFILWALNHPSRTSQERVQTYNRLKSLPDINFPESEYKNYERFLKGALVYRPTEGSDVGKIELPIRALTNPLEGSFDLSKCGDMGQYLSIATGYRKVQTPANTKKVEIWFTPRFLINKEMPQLAPNHHMRAISGNWHAARAPIGIFWTHGGWNAVDRVSDCDYLTAESPAELGSENLLKKYQKTMLSNPGYHRACHGGQDPMVCRMVLGCSIFWDKWRGDSLRYLHPQQKFHVSFVN